MPSSARVLAVRLGQRSTSAALFTDQAIMLPHTLVRRVHACDRTGAAIDARAVQDAAMGCIAAALGSARGPTGSVAAAGVCLHRSQQTHGTDTEVYHAPLEALACALPELARDGRPALADAVWAPPTSDSAAATVGAGCIDASRMSLHLGAGCSARVVAPANASVDMQGLWQEPISGGSAVYGAGPAPAGDWVEWLARTLNLPADAEELLAARTPDCHGLSVLPWDRVDATGAGAIDGLRPGASGLDILQAGMEAVAISLSGLRERLAARFPAATEVVASGSEIDRSMLWANMLADTLGAPLSLAEEPSAPERGAAILAMVAAGMLPHIAAAPAPLGPLVRHDPGRHRLLMGAVERREAFLRRLRTEPAAQAVQYNQGH
jgi:hypothetical protein